MAEVIMSQFQNPSKAMTSAGAKQDPLTGDFEPGELEKLLAKADADARALRFVDGEKAFAKLKAKSDSRRKGA
jgi:hypothetical protein